jgi:hypothetical protein
MKGIPAALKIEHEKLHADLAAATKLPGKTGEAAKQVAGVLREHFLSEEEFGKVEMPRMISEHKAIVRALDELGRAARQTL